MQQPTRNQNKKTSIEWTDDDIEQMSQINQTDLKTAEALWKQDVPPRYRDVLNAEVIEDVGRPEGQATI